MRAKLLGRATKWGYRTPYRNNKKRMRNIEKKQWRKDYNVS